ncbi:MAG: PilC/PilY family type IV pilus protein [Fulvimonas sp.]|nr:PilC/PilY family type IV pilus protein [Fulvimonas sp.]
MPRHFNASAHPERNAVHRPLSMCRTAAFLGRLLGSGLLVGVLGFFNAPPVQAVTIDPAPLIIQPTLPPNIVLMLDNSGSMDWDYMPDWNYLSNTSNDAVRNAAINGVYYNPSVIYYPPPKADGGTYTNSPGLTNAYADGFQDTTATNIANYSSPSEGFPYYTSLSVTAVSNYAPSPCDSGDTLQTSSPHNGQCKHSYFGTSYYDPGHYCNSGGTYDSSSGQCKVTSTSNKNFFTYTTGSANTQHYVGAAAGDCASLSSSANRAVCDDSAATRQNVANWFSYYRTRMLMAKSGLMRAFSGLNTNFRVGFGAIDSTASSSTLGSDYYPFTTSYGRTSFSNGLSVVKPFGSVVSGSTTQKQRFWNWISQIDPSGGTPLLQALDAAGKYYQTSQPWTTMSSDPDPTGNASTELACRQAYTILTTDGFWNGTTPSGIGDQDGTAGPTISNPNGDSSTYAPKLPYTDRDLTPTTQTTPASCDRGYSLTLQGGLYKCTKKNSTDKTPTCSSGWTLSNDQGTCSKTVIPAGISDTLADVAMKYWKTDLRTTANEVPTNTEDPAFWQHMVTFTMGLGFTPRYADQKTPIPMDQVFAWANGNASDAISDFAWPTPDGGGGTGSGGSLNNIADLAHAAVNGHGGFYSATDPDSFVAGLKAALQRASARVGTGASLAANATQTQTGTVAYQAYYYTVKWSGDLRALPIVDGAISQTPQWAASSALPTPASRSIWTYSGTAYLPFKLGAGNALPALSSAQLSALGSSDAQADMINYLRGDGSKDLAHGGSFRTRETPLGDIVDSQPIYVAAPGPDLFRTQTFTGTDSYGTFAANQVSRSPRVYVAANDGFLHGFDAATGVETYAYLPGAVITSGLTDLANPAYGDTVSHEFFNDGELTVADAYFGSAWHTVLVGTTGKGLAKAVYALDVTDPANIQFLWERSAGDGKTNSNYIGQMTGKPVIAQTADGVWSVLMGNGYNSAAGKAALLQFALSDGTLDVHQTTDTTGLAAPAVWIGTLANGVSTVAYAGDADGNVWSFTLNTGSTTATATPSSSGVKLFTATDSSNNAQPITAGMSIGKDPQSGNVWIFFGTGKYLSSADLTDMNTQTWYGLIVSSTDSTNHPAVDGTTHKGRSALVQRSITSETAGDADTLPGRTVTTLTDASTINGKSGWYIDLLSPTGVNGAAVQQGERMVTPNLLQSGFLIGTTRIPQAADACNPSGKGWIMAIDPFTGTNPQAIFFDINGSGVADAGDKINGKPAAGIGFASLPNNPIFVGSHMLVSFDNGSNTSRKTFPPPTAGALQRVSWRELISP